MAEALATLTFLGTLWLLVVVGAAILERGGPRIVAALKGEVAKQPTPNLTRLRTRSQAQVPMRVAERWRAAA